MTTPEQYRDLASKAYDVNRLQQDPPVSVGERFRVGSGDHVRRVWRVVLAVMVAGVLVSGLSACSVIGKRLMTPDPPVKEQQRASALYFRDEYQPNVEKIRFTQDGNRPGLGASWRVNAIATIEGRDYYVIIGPDIGPSFVGGRVRRRTRRHRPRI